MFGPHWQVIIGVAKEAGCIKGPAPADQGSGARRKGLND